MWIKFAQFNLVNQYLRKNVSWLPFAKAKQVCRFHWSSNWCKLSQVYTRPLWARKEVHFAIALHLSGAEQKSVHSWRILTRAHLTLHCLCKETKHLFGHRFPHVLLFFVWMLTQKDGGFKHFFGLLCVHSNDCIFIKRFNRTNLYIGGNELQLNFDFQ